MKTIQVTLTVDITNEEQMQALTNLLDYIKENVNDAAPEPTLAQRLFPSSAPAPAKTLKSAPAPVNKPATNITVDQLRELTKEKSADTGLRPKIKVKLKELGAGTVSELKEDDYEDYKSYLESI